MLRLSLRAKIVLCCIGLVAVLDVLVVMFVRSRLSDTLRDEYLTKGHNMALNLAARSQHFILTEEFVTLLQLVRDLKGSDEDIAYAYVTDRKGRVLAHTFSGGLPTDLVGFNSLDPGDRSKRQLLDTIEQGLVHDIAVPILQGRVGVVHVGISEYHIQRTISRFTLGLVLIAAFVLLVAAGSTGVVSWVITQPVRSLTTAAQKIRDGNLGQRVEVTTRDEIGDLVESFNQMSEELLKQHNVLDDRNRRIRVAQEQVAWERDKLRAIIDSMVEGVVFVDARGRISLYNHSAERIWGGNPAELLGKSVQECPSAELRSKLGKILEQTKKEPGFIPAQSLESRDGRCVISYSTVHSQEGRYLGLVLLSLDISERATLEQEHNRLREQLFQQEKMVLVGQIAASVAHELNTPLGTVLLRAQLMQQQMENGSDVSDLDVIESEARRCRGIVDSLLGFARRSEGVLSRMEVAPLIRESLSLVRNDLAIKDISVEAEYGDNGVLIWADNNQIKQVLLNVITNAADAMPDGGRLQVGVNSGEDFVEIRVTDEGGGMEDEVLEQAFDPFFTTKERGKGTGLGLPICRRIVEEHGGVIEIRSQPAQGTTVSVRLPRPPLEVTSDE
jgi:PAS domain S-box-containing protein